MKRSIASAREKIERAVKHVAELKSVVELDRALHTHEETLNHDIKKRQYFTTVQVPENPPLTWSAIVGDIAHNLRCAFDHMAFQFDRLAENERCFPLWGDRAKFHNAVMQAGVPKRFPPRAWRIIEGAQYCTRPHFHRHPMFRIDELDRRDKHRTLNLLYVPVMNQQVRFIHYDTDGNILRRSNAFTTPIVLSMVGKPRTIRWTINDPLPGAKMDVYGKFTFEVGLDESTFGKGSLLLPSIEEMIEFTRRVMEKFVEAYPSLRKESP